MTGRLRIADSAEELASEAAAIVVQAAADAVEQRGMFHLVLSGGSTPRRLYERLATAEWRNRVPWSATHLWWSDERHLPAGHPDRNESLVREALLHALGTNPPQAHVVEATATPETAAEHYDRELHRVLGSDPIFDLVLLGLGTDGHTASLFQGSSLLDRPSMRESRLAAATDPSPEEVPPAGVQRITLTPRALAHARQIVFLVQGSTKADMLAQVVTATAAPLPAATVARLGPPVLWLVDRAAAERIEP